MSDTTKVDRAEPIALDTAKVLYVDCEAASRSQLDVVLRGIGFTQIVACENQEDFSEKLTAEAPDLLFMDVDNGPDWAFETIRSVRNREVGDCPFVVIVALTKKPALDVVQAALSAGSDDMVVKPVTARALRERVVNQIENRKEFIATADYVGPDRRADDRELTEDDPAAIEVPNSLRHAATGDESAALSEERIQETLRNLSVQKFFHLSQKVTRIAGGQRDLLAGDVNDGDCTAAVQEISATLAEIDELIGEQEFKSVTQVVASTRQALAEIETCGDKVTARHFDLLHAHGGSIGVVLKESDESAGALVSALEKAVAVVKGDDGADEVKVEPGVEPESGPGADTPAEAGSSSDAPPAGPASDASPTAPAEASADTADIDEPVASEGAHKVPLMVRFKAWWEGVDPSDLMAGASK